MSEHLFWVISRGSGIAALLLHATALLGDGYLSPSLADITIPFVFDFEPLWTGAGVIGGWTLVALGLSYYARTRIGVQRWRTLHRFTALAWLLAIGHSLGAGADADRWWFLAACAIAVGPTLVLLVSRLAQSLPGAARPARTVGR